MGISSGLGGTVGAVPAGGVMPFAGSTAPAGWLLCFGQAVSRSQYGELFAVLGTSYGSGDGSTTFNLPDLRGRVVAGEDDMGGSAANRLTAAVSGVAGNTLGASGGDQLTPTHSHPNTLSNNTVATSGHTHQHVSPIGLNSGGIRVIDPGSSVLDSVGSYDLNGVVSANQNSFTAKFGDLVERWYVTSSGPSATTTVTISNQNNTGGGSSQNVQPTMVLNYIIKA
jgi:microcystin-dependent protein